MMSADPHVIHNPTCQPPITYLAIFLCSLLPWSLSIIKARPAPPPADLRREEGQQATPARPCSRRSQSHGDLVDSFSRLPLVPRGGRAENRLGMREHRRVRGLDEETVSLPGVPGLGMRMVEVRVLGAPLVHGSGLGRPGEARGAEGDWHCRPRP